MKKILIYSFLFILSSCNQPFMKAQNNENSKQQVLSTSSVTSYNSGSESNMTYSSTQNTDDGICNFKGYCSLKTKPATEIGMGFHFEKSGTQIKDTLNTQLFSRLMDLNNVKKIQMDSLTCKMIDKEIKLKFILSLTRDENDKLKKVEKYSMVYSSGFKNQKPTMMVDKIEKSSIEIIGNTY